MYTLSTADCYRFFAFIHIHDNNSQTAPNRIFSTVFWHLLCRRNVTCVTDGFESSSTPFLSIVILDLTRRNVFSDLRIDFGKQPHAPGPPTPSMDTESAGSRYSAPPMTAPHAGGACRAARRRPAHGPLPSADATHGGASPHPRPRASPEHLHPALPPGAVPGPSRAEGREAGAGGAGCGRLGGAPVAWRASPTRAPTPHACTRAPTPHACACAPRSRPGAATSGRARGRERLAARCGGLGGAWVSAARSDS